MGLKQLFKIIVVSAIAVVLWMPISAIAAENQSNQDLHQPAMLVAPGLKTKINVYPKPGNRQRRIGYGVSGDRVTVLEQVGSNEGYTWDYVIFDAAATSKGWVRSDFVALESGRAQSSTPQNSNPQNPSNNQFGDRDRGNQQQRSTSGYSQQGNQRQAFTP